MVGNVFSIEPEYVQERDWLLEIGENGIKGDAWTRAALVGAVRNLSASHSFSNRDSAMGNISYTEGLRQS
jgi:hypothetical protein